MRTLGLLLVAGCFGKGEDTSPGDDSECGDIDGSGGETGDVPDIRGGWTSTFGLYEFYDGCDITGLKQDDMDWINGASLDIDGRIPDNLTLIFSRTPEEVFYGLESIHGGVVFAGRQCIILRRRHGPDVVLMWAKRAGTHQLGNGDLLVDRAAQRFVALPLKADHVIWRRGGQRDDDETLDCFDHVQQRQLIGRSDQRISTVHAARRTQNPVRDQVAQNLQKKPLAHLAVGGQSAAGHRVGRIAFCKLYCRSYGVGDGPRQLQMFHFSGANRS